MATSSVSSISMVTEMKDLYWNEHVKLTVKRCFLHCEPLEELARVKSAPATVPRAGAATAVAAVAEEAAAAVMGRCCVVEAEPNPLQRIRTGSPIPMGRCCAVEAEPEFLERMRTGSPIPLGRCYAVEAEPEPLERIRTGSPIPMGRNAVKLPCSPRKVAFAYWVTPEYHEMMGDGDCWVPNTSQQGRWSRQASHLVSSLVPAVAPFTPPLSTANLVPLCPAWTASSAQHQLTSLSSPMEATVERNKAKQSCAPTTVLLKNIPYEYTQDMVVHLFDSEGFEKRYDFIYYPKDKARPQGKGYVFLNARSPEDAAKIHKHFDGFTRWGQGSRSRKICEAGWAKPKFQGLEQLREHHRNNPDHHHKATPEESKPIFFGENGERLRFPLPSRGKQPQKK